mmetsp:Transcript_118828/g.379074  ORF Transcript_118828/g.379074 Transcript_118828/m.379074 type:complete len:316 (-) Transcript_118828:234-1181(-)
MGAPARESHRENNAPASTDMNHRAFLADGQASSDTQREGDDFHHQRLHLERGRDHKSSNGGFDLRNATASGRWCAAGDERRKHSQQGCAHEVNQEWRRQSAACHDHALPRHPLVDRLLPACRHCHGLGDAIVDSGLDVLGQQGLLADPRADHPVVLPRVGPKDVRHVVPHAHRIIPDRPAGAQTSLGSSAVRPAPALASPGHGLAEGHHLAPEFRPEFAPKRYHVAQRQGEALAGRTLDDACGAALLSRMVHGRRATTTARAVVRPPPTCEGRLPHWPSVPGLARDADAMAEICDEAGGQLDSNSRKGRQYTYRN